MSILRYNEYITESEDIDYSYGVAMVTFNLPDWTDILGEIDENDLASGDNQKGIEEDAHITLLYGLHDDVDMEEVKKVFQNIKMINAKVVDVSLFENEKFDVVKFGIESNELLILHEWLKYSFNYTSDFPDYKPHVTIAYVKPGEGAKYVDELTDKYLKDGLMEVKLNEIVLSDSDNKEVKIKLKD